MALTPFPTDPLVAYEGVKAALDIYRAGQITTRPESFANALWNVAGVATAKTLEDSGSGPFGAPDVIPPVIETDADAIAILEQAAVQLDPTAAPFAASGAISPFAWAILLKAARWLAAKIIPAL